MNNNTNNKSERIATQNSLWFISFTHITIIFDTNFVTLIPLALAFSRTLNFVPMWLCGSCLSCSRSLTCFIIWLRFIVLCFIYYHITDQNTIYAIYEMPNILAATADAALRPPPAALSQSQCSANSILCAFEFENHWRLIWFLCFAIIDFFRSHLLLFCGSF